MQKPSERHGVEFAQPQELPMHEGSAVEIVDLALNKPELLVHSSNLPATAAALRDLFAKSGAF
jgi:hypothetical protein